MKTAQTKGSSAPRQQGESSNLLANQVFRLALFDHLPRKQTPKDPDSVEEDRFLHPTTIHLGLMYNKGYIQSDDDRVRALIEAFLTIIKDYKTPPKKSLREDLDKYISKQVQHLVDCRQISKSMGNVIKFVRQCISTTPPALNESDAKAALLSKLEEFYEEKVQIASEHIARYVASTINENDVILTFGSSPLIRKVFLHVAEQKTFQLVVIDTRPLHEGIQTLTALSDKIKCIYAPLSGTANMLKDVKKVILGASCLLSNGSMLAPAGTAMVAALAKTRHIPVIVASESYKFSDKVQLDSIVFNELGHPSELVKVSTGTGSTVTSAVEGGSVGNDEQANYSLPVTEGNTIYHISPQGDNTGYRGSADKLSIFATVGTTQETVMDTVEYLAIPPPPSQTSIPGVKVPFEVVNLRYDLTPLTNISVIATETGLIPPTSIPILIREIQSDLQAK